MRTRTKWFIAGGAAAFVLTPVAAVSGSTTLDADLPQHGLMIEAQAAGTTQPSAKPTAKKNTTTAVAKGTKETKEPTGKKTVSAVSPVSPHTAVSPRTALSPKSPG
ncbi:MAG: hypothetical protein QM650_14070 [Microlunatus sp.]